MLKSNRGKLTVRKPLVDISNGGKPSRFSKKKGPGGDGGGRAALDRLLLARSELSNLLGEIDELVAQALENKRIDKKANQDIESFRNILSDMHSSLKIDELVAQALENKRIDKKSNQDIESFRNILSDMHSSLKPWVPRLWQSFGSTLATGENQRSQTTWTTSVSCINDEENALPVKNESELDLIVSPSPLVSWRAGSCTLETGRQLFLLTPLPKSKVVSSKCPVTSKSMVRILHDKNQHGLPLASTLPDSARDGLFEKLETEVPPGNVVKPCTLGTKNDTSESTTYVSPLKCNSSKDSVFLLTPCLKTSPPKSSAFHGLIPENIPALTTRDNGSKGSDGLTNDDVLDGLTSRYQELLGLQPGNNCSNRRTEVNQSLDWFLSPPKTCILMEPTEEKLLPTPVNNSILLLATPVWKDVESTVHRDKRPGENTLKKELWTRFEEVSRDGLHFNASVFQKSERKGFLDMLEEACETPDYGGRK